MEQKTKHTLSKGFFDKVLGLTTKPKVFEYSCWEICGDIVKLFT